MGCGRREMGCKEHDEKFGEAEGQAEHSAIGYEMIDCSAMYGKPEMGLLIGRI